MTRKPDHQIMANLPIDRVSPDPPFTSVGVDTFGPWEIAARRTRRGIVHAKRWVIMFSCHTSRAVHIEVIGEMSSSSFINALRRFIAIKGHVKDIQSDRGTNLVGSTDSLGIYTVNVEDDPIKIISLNNRTVWIFNPSHSYVWRMGTYDRAYKTYFGSPVDVRIDKKVYSRDPRNILSGS